MQRIPIEESINPILLCENYQPPNHQIYTGEQRKQGRRKMFYHVEFTEFEKQKLIELLEFLQSEQGQPYLKQIPDNVPIQEYLRALYGCNFIAQQGAQKLVDHINWRTEYLPYGIQTLYTEKTIKILEKGTFYAYGRDLLNEPIVIINFHQIDVKFADLDEYIAACVFLLQYVIQNMMMRGKVEAWFILIDFNNMGILDLPIQTIKKLVNIMQENFRCRLNVQFFVHIPFSLKIIWKIAQPFIDPETKEKIQMYGNKAPNELYKYISKDQLEQKFGGKLPNLTQFWPPKVSGLEDKIKEYRQRVQQKKDLQQHMIQQTQSTTQVNNTQPQIQLQQSSPQNFEQQQTPQNFDQQPSSKSFQQIGTSQNFNSQTTPQNLNQLSARSNRSAGMHENQGEGDFEEKSKIEFEPFTEPSQAFNSNALQALSQQFQQNQPVQEEEKIQSQKQSPKKVSFEDEKLKNVQQGQKINSVDANSKSGCFIY